MISLIVAMMILFAVLSSTREVLLYRRCLKGEIHYLVSRQRRNRRLLIAFLLLLEAAFLFLGSFILSFDSPGSALLFWIPPLLLVVLVVYLGMLDFRETSRDIDRIVRDASETVRKRIKDAHH